MKFLDCVFDRLPHFYDKIEESVRKTKRKFGPYSGATTKLVVADIIEEKK